VSYRSPESKRIPEVREVCFLKDAVAPPFSDDHHICIAYPVTPGLQAALILAPVTGNTTARVTDTLAIIPGGVPHSGPQNDHIYRNYLGFVQHAQRKTIQRIATNDFLRLWRKRTEMEPPFGHVTLDRLTKELEPLLLTPTNVITSANALAAIRAAWGRSLGWLIPHVHDNAMERHRKTDRRHEKKGNPYWWILNQWVDWERRGLDMVDRYLAYQAEYGGKINDLNYRKRLNTFRKMCCGFLRLPYSGRTDKRKMKRLRIKWQRAREARANSV
jgi:hypothetical protein